MKGTSVVQEENPFESLSKGLHKNLSLVLEQQRPEGIVPPSHMPVASVLGNGSLSSVQLNYPHIISRPRFVPLSDRFEEQLAVFPLSKGVVINKFGAYIPQSMFGSQANITYEENRSSDGSVNITVHS